MSNWPLSVMHTIEHCTAYTDRTLFRIKMSWHQSKHTHINMSYTEPLSFVQSRLNYIKCSLISSSIFRFFNIHFAGSFIRCMLPVHHCTALYIIKISSQRTEEVRSPPSRHSPDPSYQNTDNWSLVSCHNLTNLKLLSQVRNSGLDIKITDTINRTTYVSSSLVDLFTHLCIHLEGICIWYQAHFWGFILVGQLVNPGGYLNANHLSFYSEFACSFLGWAGADSCQKWRHMTHAMSCRHPHDTLMSRDSVMTLNETIIMEILWQVFQPGRQSQTRHLVCHTLLLLFSFWFVSSWLSCPLIGLIVKMLTFHWLRIKTYWPISHTLWCTNNR